MGSTPIKVILSGFSFRHLIHIVQYVFSKIKRHDFTFKAG